MADDGHDGGVAVVRRAPFSDNPRVGARGQRTQQRILDAALRAFGAEGYHACSIDRITKLARCSRVAFYQYFASKEDVFHHLAEQVARQVSASTEAIDPLTADAAGWAATRTWIARYADIHARYDAVFHSLDTDPELAALANRTGQETIGRIRARVEATTLPARSVDPVIVLLLECVNYSLDVADILRAVQPEPYSRDRVEDALTHVVHRTLFGVAQEVNAAPFTDPPAAPLEFDERMLALLAAPDAVTTGNAAHDAILATARDVFVARGYHATRVSDLVAAAGVSHGAFYRYFENKEALARVLTARAVASVGETMAAIPDSSAGGHEPAALRRWLRTYHAAQSGQTAMLRVWADAALQSEEISAESAPLFDWGRRRMARYLAPRGFGDVGAEAIVMVALLGVFGSRGRPARDVDAAALVIERGLLAVASAGGGAGGRREDVHR